MPQRLQRYLDCSGFSIGLPPRVERGTQSVCYLIERVDTQQRIAIKLFNDPAETARATEEFEALAELHRSLDRMGQVCCPAPIRLLPSEVGAGYIMTAIPGVPLSEFLASTSSPPITPMAKAIAGAVAAYHRQTSSTYGDFHPANVLVSDNGKSLALIDPICPSPRHARVEASLHAKFARYPVQERLMIIDVGYWLYSIVVQMIRGRYTSAHLAKKQFAFAKGLMSSIDSRDAGSLCVQAAQEHLRFPRHRRTVQARAMELIVRLTLCIVDLHLWLSSRAGQRQTP